MPNLFSDLPVEILAWVFASTSGLTRIETGASRPIDDRDLRQGLELGLALDVEAEDAGLEAPRAISARVLPTPENTIRSGGDAGRERAPQLALRDDVHAGARGGPASRSTAWFELAFMA